AAETGLTPAARLGDWRPLVALLDGVATTLASFRPEVYGPELPAFVTAPAPLAAAEQSALWRRVSRDGRSPRLPGDYPAVKAAADRLHSELSTLDAFLPGTDLWALT